jgi:HNH endonuclease
MSDTTTEELVTPRNYTVDRRQYRGAPEAQRFWAKVAVTPDCWLWLAATQRGYGVFTSSSGKQVKAHRWSYEHLVGPVEFSLDHLCRVRNCVNPDHLEDVPMGENNRRSIGFRERRTHCPRGHAYAEFGRPGTGGHPNCRLCDNEAHRNARSARA